VRTLNHYDITRAACKPNVHRGGESHTRIRQHSDAWESLRIILDNRPGLVLAQPINDQDFETLMGIPILQD
jgi:hypothetical protein